MRRSLSFLKRGYPFFLLFAILTLTNCQLDRLEHTAPSPDPESVSTPTSLVNQVWFTQDEISTLNSIQRVDEHPLYVMQYQGEYPDFTFSKSEVAVTQRPYTGGSTLPPWGCSLLATLADPDSAVLGRNFDWDFSPALLLFTDPPGGYASASMVDLAYFFDPTTVTRLTELDLAGRSPLLNTPSMPFDGVNERGLAIGMAAVPDSQATTNPNLESVGSLQIIRLLLDHAANVGEALTIMKGVNITWDGGPPLHYLLADAHGTASLVEFREGEMVVFTNTHPWHQATNFPLSDTSGPAEGVCHRYDLLSERLQEKQGELTPAEAMELLEDVSQTSTQWSVVYQLFTGEITIAMDRKYSQIHTFQLENTIAVE
jgi:hypothetical protein